MITVIHGQNSTDAYLHLKDLEKKTAKVNTAKFSKEKTKDDLYLEFYGSNLLEEKTLFVCENFLTDKKIKPADEILKNKDAKKNIIFWEHDQLSAQVVSKLPKTIVVELFKKQSDLYSILDSIGQNPLTTIKILHNSADKEGAYSLIYMLTERIFLLVLAKSGYSAKSASNFLKRPLADWQWQKIRNQSAVFSLPVLLSLFKGILKIDEMIKTGKTDMPPKTLIGILFLKYLKSEGQILRSF